MQQYTTIPVLASLKNDDNPCYSVAFHPTAPVMATSSDNTIKLWRLSPDNVSARCVATLDKGSGGHDGSVLSIAFHPTALVMATGSSDKTIKLWHLSPDNASARCVATLDEKGSDGHDGSVLSIAFHPITSLMATGSSDKTIKLWHLSPDNASARCVATLDNRDGAAGDDSVLCVAFHPAAPLMATGSKNHTAKLWLINSDNSNAECLTTMRGHSKPVYAVAFHPTALLLATGSNNVRLWRLSIEARLFLSTATCVANLAPYKHNDVLSLAFQPNPHPNTPAILAISSEDSTAQLWRILPDNKTATCIAYLNGHRNSVLSIAFHPTALMLATSSIDETVKLWDCRQLLSERWQLATVSKGLGGLTNMASNRLSSQNAPTHFSRRLARIISSQVASKARRGIKFSKFNKNMLLRLGDLYRRFYTTIPSNGAIVLPLMKTMRMQLKRGREEEKPDGEKSPKAKRGGTRRSKRAKIPPSKRTRTTKKKW